MKSAIRSRRSTRRREPTTEIKAAPLQNLLAKTQPNLECTYIEEPELALQDGGANI